ncbi:anti-phage protein KwaB [Telluribacter sp.]|jgi:hypothetical protein|uniref:anti-phage protein KwaB n=1 Tax=Telluribacter sp. TaxID=1978767 RepID=UPI002E0F65E1|nr:anti-phage protein KwaB [Telluribacter sp.]
MTIQELREKISFLYDSGNAISLSMYMILNSGEIRFANLEEETRGDLKEKFLNYLSERTNESNDLHYCNLTEYNDTKNTICYYDLPDPLPGLQPLNVVSSAEEQQEFEFNANSFADIEAFAFLIGNETQNIAIYKKNYNNINLIKRDSSVIALVTSILSDKSELVKVKSDILKVNEKFDFMLVENHVLVMNTKYLETDMGYLGILIKAARTKFEIIQKANIVENINELEDLISDKKYAKKFVKIRPDTPVLGIEFSKLREFIENHPALKNKIKFNDTLDKIKFHSKISKDLFIKLLYDSYLKSELTDLLYESENKLQLPVEKIE